MTAVTLDLYTHSLGAPSRQASSQKQSPSQSQTLSRRVAQCSQKR